MVSEKKIEFLSKQGFEREIIKMFVNCGVDKHLVWFLSKHKKSEIEHLNGEDIRIVNLYLNNIPSTKVKKHSYSEALVAARRFEKNEKRKLKNKIYHFENGFYISILNAVDLKEDGIIMSNCVGGYEEKISNGIVGILALKQPSGKTVAHIEINKNGLIGQNYAKGNMPLSKNYWMMILEFFKNNSKAVDLSNLFGESHIATCIGGNISEVILSIPISVNMFIENGVKKSEQIQGFEVKRFSPLYKNNNQSVIKISSKSDVIDWIEQKKLEVIKAYEDLSIQVLATSASQLYLSDNMKEKIFGTNKGAYLMKGDKCDLLEMRPNGQAFAQELMEVEPDEEIMEPIMEQPEEIPEMERINDEINDINGIVDDVLEPAPAIPGGRRRPIILLGRRLRHQDGGNEVVMDNGGLEEVEDGEDEPQIEQFMGEDMPKKEMTEEEMIEDEIRNFEKDEEKEGYLKKALDETIAEQIWGRNPRADDIVNERADERAQLAVEEIPYDGEYEAIAEDVEGNFYGIENIRAQMINEIEEINAGEIAPPEPFQDIIRRAVRR